MTSYTLTGDDRLYGFFTNGYLKLFFKISCKDYVKMLACKPDQGLAGTKRDSDAVPRGLAVPAGDTRGLELIRACP